MIPGNGVYRIRRGRFAEVRSGSTMGGSGKGVSNNRLVSVSILSISSLKPAKGVGCSRHESSMLASAPRRSLPGDVELELGILVAHKSGTAGRRGVCIEGNLFRDRKRINSLNISDRNWRVHQTGESTLLLYPLHNLNLWNFLKIICGCSVAAKSSKRGNESTTCGACIRSTMETGGIS